MIPTARSPAVRIPRYLLSLPVFLLFASLPLLFAICTENAWEDYYITFRASKNLAMGHGLVFMVGEHLHSFTSPLGTLLPALCSVVAGVDHDDLALWLFRLTSAVAFGFTGVQVFLTLHKRGLSALSLVLTLALLALDAKAVMYSSNGMETGFMLLFLSLSFYLLTTETKRTALYLGLAWGAVMWTRPDGFIYAGALAVSFLAFRAGIASPYGRAWLLRKYVGAAFLAALVYAPWFFWAWSYYGSPIPHTVVAKGLAVHGSMLDTWLSRVTWERCIQLVGNFVPGCLQFEGWDSKFTSWGLGLWALAALPSVMPGMPRMARAVSTAFIIACVYLFWITPYAYWWYIPNGAWMGYIAIGFLFHQWSTTATRQSIVGRLLAAVTMIFAQTVILVLVVQQIGAQQRTIETAHRKVIGLWLREHAATERDTVFLECLGYIGYYSNLKMYDFPGLCSEEVVAVRRKLGTDDFTELIHALRPDWLVLRPSEMANVSLHDRQLLLRDYDIAKVFDTSAQVGVLPVTGKSFLEYDQKFTVFHRRNVTL